MDEKELDLLTKQGDVKAFCTLYDKYKRKLYSYAYFKLNNQQDAEDAVQDCALTAFEEISKLKIPTLFLRGYSEYFTVPAPPQSKGRFAAEKQMI